MKVRPRNPVFLPLAKPSLPLAKLVPRQMSEFAPKGALAAMGALLLALSPGDSFAQDVDADTWIQLSGYYPKVDTKVGIARADDPDFRTLIDLESDLDLSDRDILPSLAAGTRLGGNWLIEGEYYRLKRSGERSIAREIVFDGVTYPVSAELSSSFASNVYRLAVGYSFVRQNNLELGASLGIHATDFTVKLQGEGRAAGGSITTEARARDVLAPLPTIGLYGAVSPAPKVLLGAKGDFLSLKIDDYDGRLINLQASASYAVTRNLKIGVLYRYVDYRLDVEKERYTGRMAYKFQGPGLFLGLQF